MKKTFLGFIIAFLFVVLFGCTEKPDQGILTFEVADNTVSGGEAYYSLIDDDSNQYGVVLIQLGEVTTDNKGVVRLVNNQEYVVTITLDRHISGENIKVYYNDALISLSSFSEIDNEYNFNFTSGSLDHNIRVDGIAKDLKRKMSVSLPCSGMEYMVFFKNDDGSFHQIHSENNEFEMYYGSDLVFKVEMKADVLSSWDVSYKKIVDYSEIVSEENTIVNSSRSKTFTILVDSNISDIEVIGVQPVQ